MSACQRMLAPAHLLKQRDKLCHADVGAEVCALVRCEPHNKVVIAHLNILYGLRNNDAKRQLKAHALYQRLCSPGELRVVRGIAPDSVLSEGRMGLPHHGPDVHRLANCVLCQHATPPCVHHGWRSH